ncbi:MAG: preprotein translocase subunit SecA [Calditrichaeota bacterium]|nr:preprotein translocase subunit SecA [Calditrichota bacterium]MCB9391526.1 preprotein translocase subunit SecA [Calditrichota bacterium]
MFDFFLSKIFGTKHDRSAKKLRPLVDAVNGYETEYQSLTTEQLRAKTDEFRTRLNDGEILDDIMVEAYAAVKNACRRLMGHEYDVRGQKVTWNMLPYDVQIIGGIALHQGKIAEMATGEGKTLVATFALYLNALPGKGAHLVTVNDYLAQRDSEWMGPVFEMLGLSVGVITSDMPPPRRREEYGKDITYGTNNEFGFDYLRDNMALHMDYVVQRGHHYAIVDEVDSVLIDEARTPLIISGPVEHSTQRFDEMKSPVEQLVRLQSQLIIKLADEVEKMLAEPKFDEFEAGKRLLKLHRGFPKHKRTLKLFQEPSNVQLRQRVENEYLRDKKMHELDEELYFSIEEKGHQTDLTEQGRLQLTKYHGGDPDLFLLPDLADEFAKLDVDDSLAVEDRAAKKTELQSIYAHRAERVQNVSQLLKAYALYEKDVEYVVQDGKVQIVDEFTGRILSGRRYSDGLHQAIEAKEGVKIERETQTIATITLQNYFRLYGKLAGMTGTAETEESEFFSIYKLEVMVIPTHQQIRRDDMNDLIYRTKREKYNAIVDRIAELHGNRQPVLVGTASVEASELLSRMLKGRRIPHEVLNAKQHQKEAEIVAKAGQLGAVTIATNMAGRGTDIKLGQGVVSWQGDEGDKSKAEGGLFILGTERHESRRIDRQLRGRAGRQGDPGASQFYVSLEDDLMRLFGSDRMASVMDRLGLKEGEVISAGMITRSIGRAQQRVEEYNFSIRKHLLEYDDVMNQQRSVVYSRRNIALRGEDPSPLVDEMIGDYVDFVFEKHGDGADIHREGVVEDVMRTFLIDMSHENEFFAASAGQQHEMLQKKIDVARANRGELLGEELFRELQRQAILRVIDIKWKDHLYGMDGLKEGVGLRAYGQKDPLIEYKKEGFTLFQSMLDEVNTDALRIMFSYRLQTEPRSGEAAEPPRVSRTPAMTYSHASAAGMAYSQPPSQGGQPAPGQPSGQGQVGKKEPVRVEQRVGRNDPCPCGSGKKYKKCHGAAEEVSG